MKRWRMLVIQLLLLLTCILVIYVAFGPVVALSHEMAQSFPRMAVYRPWILVMAWIILLGVVVCSGVLLIAANKLYRSPQSLYSFSSFVSLKGAAKALEVSQMTAGLLILLLLVSGAGLFFVFFLAVGLLLSLLASQVMRLFAEVIREASDMQDDLKFTI